MITYFKTINDTDKPYHIDIYRAIDRIRDGSSKDLIGRPLAKSLSKKTSRLEVVKVHHSPRAPPQAERCGVLCCLTVTHFRVLLVTRCMCGGNR